MTEDEYWGTLKGWGLTGKRRVTPGTFTMLDRDGDVCNVPNPTGMTEADRVAALQIIKALHVRLDS